MFWAFHHHFIAAFNGCAVHVCQILHLRQGRGFILLVFPCLVRTPDQWINDKHKPFKKNLKINFHSKIRFPFDWKTPCGYLVAWFTQCAGCIVGVNIDIQFLNLVFGSCWLFIFIAEDITQDVIEFNLFVAEATSNEDRTECTKRFRGMVQVYTDAKQ